jgi:hypothetical protein
MMRGLLRNLLDDLCDDHRLIGVVHPLLICEGWRWVEPNEGGLASAPSDGIGGLGIPPKIVWCRLVLDCLVGISY